MFSLMDRDTYLQSASSCWEKQLSEPLEGCAVNVSSCCNCSTIKTSNTSVPVNSSRVSVCHNQSQTQTFDLPYTQLHISTTNQTPTVSAPVVTDSPTKRDQDTSNISSWGYALIVIVAVLAILMVFMTIIVVVLCVDHYQKHQTRGN